MSKDKIQKIVKMIWFTYLLYPIIVQGLDLQISTKKAFKVCNAYGHQVVKAKFGKETHLLCLKSQKISTLPVSTNQSMLLLNPGLNEETSGEEIKMGDITMAYGFPVEDPSAGSAEGYIGDDHHFYGVLHLGNRTLHADPYETDDPNKFFGEFENDNMLAPLRERRDHTLFSAGFADQLAYFPFHIEDKKKQPGVAKSRICDLLLLADKEFFEKDANSSLNQVVRRMMHAVAQADLIFRNADFNEDGVPDNIGFSVKYILVLTSNETNFRVFGNIVKNTTVDGRTYLMRFARLRRLSEVCLGIAFSGHAFQNRTLGLSFTSLGGGMGGAAGGLCDRRAYGRSFNTLALAHAAAAFTERIPERVAALTLAHEMGHSFGAHHDDHFPSPACRGYLMGSQSGPDNPHQFEFSLCSKRLIAATLSSMSYCLTESDEPFCGNGIVEEGEACDCGLPSSCSKRDPCCTPRAGGAIVFEDGALHKEGCAVAPSARCHPSQGLCCTSDCEYANYTASGIDCSKQDLECTCTNLTSDCRCGLGGRCLPDGTCHAAECAVLGLRECKCPQSGPGGNLGKAQMCGICCAMEMPGDLKERCAGSEFAAVEVMKSNQLPYNWPDEDYTGPNVTITICNQMSCRMRPLRAWPPGGVCVSLNQVGTCTGRATCQHLRDMPASNIYPDAVQFKHQRNAKSMTKNLQASKKVLTLIFIIKCLEMCIRYLL